MIHVLYSFLIAINIACIFLPTEYYNFWNPMAIGFIAGLWSTLFWRTLSKGY